MALVAIPTIQFGLVSAAGILFNPSLVLGASLSIGLLVRLISEKVVARRAWTATGAISVCTVIAAMSAVVLSAIVNDQNLSNCIPWLVSAGVALSLVLGARLGYLSSSAIPLAVLTGFAISATSDLRRFVQGTAIATGVNAGRFVGGLGDYELLGEFYTVAIIIALATLVHVRRLAVSLLALYVIGLGLILVFATHGRSSVVLLAVTCPLLLIAPLFGSSVSRPRLLLMIAAAVSLAMALAPLILSSDTFARLSGVDNRGGFAQTINRDGVLVTCRLRSEVRLVGPIWQRPSRDFRLVRYLSAQSLTVDYMVPRDLRMLFSRPADRNRHFRNFSMAETRLGSGIAGFSLIVLLVDEIVIEFPRQGSMTLFVLALSALVGAAPSRRRGHCWPFRGMTTCAATTDFSRATEGSVPRQSQLAQRAVRQKPLGSHRSCYFSGTETRRLYDLCCRDQYPRRVF